MQNVDLTRRDRGRVPLEASTQDPGEQQHGHPPLERMPALDGIRGLAIAMVLLGHAYGLLPGLAAAGVGLFFVLSGFLITTILLKERERSGRISFPRFYARRVLRLLPALTVLLAAAAVSLFFLDGKARSDVVRSIWTSATYVSNWFQAFGQPHESALGHTWSLATEEQFYLLWPVTLAALAFFLRRRATIAVILAMIGTAALVRGILYAVPSPIHDALYFSPFTWADALLIGCLAGVIYSWRLAVPGPAGPPLVAGLAFALVAMASGSGTLMFNGGATAIAVVCALLIWNSLAPGRVSRLMGNRILAGLGRISYGAYLWQGPIVFLSIHRWESSLPRPLVATGAIAASLLVALLSYRFVERPFLNMKDRLWLKSAG